MPRRPGTAAPTEVEHVLSPLEPLATPTRLSDVVFERIKSAILNGALPAGAPIKDADLAQQLGVSRMPVREALQRLSRIGLVEVAASRFTRVTIVTPDLVAETREFAGHHAAVLARLTIPQLSVREAHELSRAIRDAIAAVDADSPALVATRPIYRRLAALTRNRFLAEMLADVEIAVERNLAHLDEDEAARARVRETLAELRAAVERGDADAAADAAMRQHGAADPASARA
jgi:DNA-binding GntR family transcriptional regulator